MKYEKCNYTDLKSFAAYLAALSSPIDSFLEGQLLKSDYYRIISKGDEAGFFAIRNNTLLTQFYLTDTTRSQGQDIFSDILKQFKPESAFVPSCDELFLSHALDAHTELKLQAMFYHDVGEAIDFSTKQSQLDYRLAETTDIPALTAVKDSIIDDPLTWIQKNELHVGYLDDELVAIGVIESSPFWPERASIGMMTHESYRQRGIGTQTLLYLKQTCRDNGILAVAGCGYGNTHSQKTLWAAGMASVTRLLKLTF